MQYNKSAFLGIIVLDLGFKVFRCETTSLTVAGKWRNTCKGLKEACEVEEASFGNREELTHKHQEGDGAEDHREDHESLDRLQPVCGAGGVR